MLTALGRWKRRPPFRDLATPTSREAARLALEGHFDPAAGQGLDGAYWIRFGEESFRVRAAGERFSVTRADPAGSDAANETHTEVFAEVLARVRNGLSPLLKATPEVRTYDTVQVGGCSSSLVDGEGQQPWPT